MKLTKLEMACLEIALEYSTCDYEECLKSMIENDFSKSEIKEQRQVLKGMKRVQEKLWKEI